LGPFLLLVLVYSRFVVVAGLGDKPEFDIKTLFIKVLDINLGVENLPRPMCMICG
jgi:hypothetical protein